MKKYNLMGNIFGYLTVISPAKIIFEGKKRKPKKTWNCACKCGNVIIAKTYHLMNGGVKSCGCLREELKLVIKPDQIFGRLTTVKYIGDSVWECKCDCNTIKLVKSNKLRGGKTKSCGCLRRETSKKNIKIAQDKIRNKNEKDNN